MRRVSLVEFRRNAGSILRRVQRGERLILTSRGRPVVRLEPIRDAAPVRDDPVYRLADLADERSSSMSNRAMDRAIYGF